jgi:hypothetical protein
MLLGTSAFGHFATFAQRTYSMPYGTYCLIDRQDISLRHHCRIAIGNFLRYAGFHGRFILLYFFSYR